MIEIKPDGVKSELIHHSKDLEEFQIVCVHWEHNNIISLLMQDAQQKGFWYTAVLTQHGVTFNGNSGVGVEQYCKDAKGKGRVYGFYNYEDFGKWASEMLPPKK